MIKACLVDIHVDNHYKQLLYYVAKLNMYTVALENQWLQIHTLAIDWRDCTMKFKSVLCMENRCLLHDIPCIKFLIGSKLRDKIKPDKLKAKDNDINIKSVSVKYFF